MLFVFPVPTWCQPCHFIRAFTCILSYFFQFFGCRRIFFSFILNFRKNNSGNQELAFFIPAVAKQNLIYGHLVPFISILSHFFQISVPLSQVFSCYISGIAVYHIIRIINDLCCLRLGDKCKDRNIFEICKRKMKGDLSFIVFSLPLRIKIVSYGKNKHGRHRL